MPSSWPARCGRTGRSRFRGRIAPREPWAASVYQAARDRGKNTPIQAIPPQQGAQAVSPVPARR